MRCELCQELDLSLAGTTSYHDSGFSRLQPYQHHVSFQALEESAKAGCDLCRVFAVELRHEMKTDHAIETAASNGASTSISLSMSGSGQETVQNAIGSINATVRVDVYTHLFVQCDTNVPGEKQDLAGSVLSREPEALGAFLELYCEEDDEAAKSLHIVGRPICPDPLTETCLSLIQSWIQKCCDHHERCVYTNAAPLPSRLIDVSQQPPRLVDTSGQHGEYLCLSHCWGGVEECKTMRNTLQSHEQGLRWAELPLNFRDAITFTRALRVPYLWIDSICIVQDDVSDWERETERMGLIYANSKLTIAAAVAQDSTVGFIPRRPHASLYHALGAVRAAIPYKDDFMDKFGTLYLRPRSQGWKDTIDDGVLSSRGWTLQERLLSPRLVHFGRDQVFWECSTCVHAEGGLWPSEYPLASLKRQLLYPQPEIENTQMQLTLNPSPPIPSASTDNDVKHEDLKGKRPMEEYDAPKEENDPPNYVPLPDLPAKSVEAAKALGIYDHLPDNIKAIFYPTRRLGWMYFETEDPYSTGLNFQWRPNEIFEPVHASPYNQWFRVVAEYTRRRLTIDEDFFPALSSVTAHFISRTDDEFHAGLWKNDFLRGLLWKTLVEETSSGRMQHPWAADEYRAPTWSWASIEGPCVYEPEELAVRDSTFDPEVVDADICTDVTDPGPIWRDGLALLAKAYNTVLLVKAPVIEARLRGFENYHPAVGNPDLWHYDIESLEGEYLGQASFGQGPGLEADKDRPFKIIRLGHWARTPPNAQTRPHYEPHGLLLLRTSLVVPRMADVYTHSQQGTIFEYFRAGTFRADGPNRLNLFDENATETLLIR